MLNTIKDIKNKLVDPIDIDEPVDLDDVKAWLIIDADNSDDDTLLGRLIAEVRQAVEKKTKLSLVAREITVTVDLVREFKLPYGPVRSIDIVSFRKGTNGDGTPDNETLTIESYTTDGEDFKVLRSKFCGRHKITYKTGYGEDEDLEYDNPVTEDLKKAILSQIAFAYENRGDSNAAGKFSDIALSYLTPYIDTAWV